MLPLRVFISTNDTEQCRNYLRIAKDAITSINDAPTSAITTDDLPGASRQPLTAARRAIEAATVFIGIYDQHYGDVPAGEQASYAELAYHHARMLDKPCLLYVHEDARDTSDERQAAFLRHIEQRHIIHTFQDGDDLAAQLKIGMSNYRRNQMPAAPPKLQPPSLNMRPGSRRSTAQTSDEQHDLPQLVSRALNLAENDLEALIRRSLELHEAEKAVQSSQIPEDYDGYLTVKPIFGEPLRRSQFQADIFMIMPFRERFNAIYTDVVQPVVAELNLTIKRGDEFSSTRGSIMAEVWAAINACRFVVVETTEINANVYYELGIAHTLGKPAILLTQTKNVDELPFDIRHLRFLVYEDSIDGANDLKAALKRSIIWLMNDLDEAMPPQP